MFSCVKQLVLFVKIEWIVCAVYTERRKIARERAGRKNVLAVDCETALVSIAWGNRPMYLLKSSSTCWLGRVASTKASPSNRISRFDEAGMKTTMFMKTMVWP